LQHDFLAHFFSVEAVVVFFAVLSLVTTAAEGACSAAGLATSIIDLGLELEVVFPAALSWALAMKDNPAIKTMLKINFFICCINILYV
jgi:hypothetical protein